MDIVSVSPLTANILRIMAIIMGKKYYGKVNSAAIRLLAHLSLKEELLRQISKVHPSNPV